MTEKQWLGLIWFALLIILAVVGSYLSAINDLLKAILEKL